MAKVKIRDLKGGASFDKKYDYKIYNLRYNEYLSLLMNAFKITHKDGSPIDTVQENFAKRTLIEKGAVGFDKITASFSYANGQGLNKMGNPTSILFVYKNGESYLRNAFYDKSPIGAYILYSTENKSFNFGDLISEVCEKISLAEDCIKQNLIASKTPFVAVVRDEDTRLSLKHAISQKENGDPAIVISEGLASALTSVDFNVEYMVDKFVEYQNGQRDHLFNKLGIMSANVDKKERVQSTEVNATVGQCVDYLYMMIDFFNKQCENFDLDFKMVSNNALEELYTNENSYDVENLKKGENENDKL